MEYKKCKVCDLSIMRHTLARSLTAKCENGVTSPTFTPKQVAATKSALGIPLTAAEQARLAKLTGGGKVALV